MTGEKLEKEDEGVKTIFCEMYSNLTGESAEDVKRELDRGDRNFLRLLEVFKLGRQSK